MDCFPDYCLACDRQIVDGLYCSQACRMADLERAGSSPASPTTSQSFTAASEDLIKTHNSLSTYDLAAAFSKASSASTLGRSSSATSFNSTLRSASALQRRSFSHASSAPPTPSHSLSTSSSRSSLASGISGLHSNRGSDGLSQEARNELKTYFDALDHTRERRRRSYPIHQQYVLESTGMTPLLSYEDE